MAKIVFGMMQSLDGYVAGIEGGPEMFPPGPALSQYLYDHLRTLAGSLCGRRTYEVSRYWDEDQPGWDELDHEFAAFWRAHPKWVASRTLTSVGPNATLVGGNIEEFVQRLKADIEGTIGVSGPELAGALSKAGLIDEYHLYYRPFVFGGGKPYFTGPLPPLRLIETTMVGEDAAKLILVPT